MRRRRSTLRMALVAVAALVVAAAGYAYTASSSVPARKAGDGATAISGYTVSNIAYTLDANDPSTVASATFSLNLPATSVRVRLGTSGTYATCSVTAGASPTATCPFPTPLPSVNLASQIRIIAAT